MTQIIDKLFKSKILLASFFSIAVVLLAVIVYWSISPSNSPARIIVSIKDGNTLSQAANELQNDKVIKSELIYKVFVVLLGGRRKVIAGDYLSIRRNRLCASRLNRERRRRLAADQGDDSRRYCFIYIGRLLAAKIPNFNSKAFVAIAKPEEGYLFPDTYYFYETMSAQDRGHGEE